MIKFVKFYRTGTGTVSTFFTEEQTVGNNEQTHLFTDAQDAVSKSTKEVFTFWDNEPIGVGLLE